MIISIVKSNEKLIEARCKNTDGIMEGNTLINGYSADEVEIKEVDDTEYARIMALPVNQSVKVDPRWEPTKYILNMLEENNVITKKQKDDFTEKVKTEKDIDIKDTAITAG